MLHELASVLGRGRAAAVVHPDVEATAKPRCALLTAFVALQDVDADMGPTVFLPGTHARAVHRALRCSAPTARHARRSIPARGRAAAQRHATLRARDVAAFDALTLHAGQANRSALGGARGLNQPKPS